MAKKIWYILIGVIITTHTCSTVFAQTKADESPEQAEDQRNCSTCGAPSSEFTQYRDFVREILAVIQNQAPQGKYLGRYVSPGFFQGQILNVSDENRNALQKIGRGLTRNINQKVQTLASTTAIFLAIGKSLIAEDRTIGITLLFGSEPFVRDWATLLDLDTDINDKNYELGLSAGRNENINSVDMEKIQAIMKKYGPEGKKLFSQATIHANVGVKYRHVTSMLLDINSMMKKFIGLNRIQQFDNVRTYAGSDLTIQFDHETIEFMQEKYRCARGLTKCTQSRNKFKQDISTIEGQLTEGGQNAGKTFTDAVGRLRTAFDVNFSSTNRTTTSDPQAQTKRDQEREYLNREYELLNTHYGIDTERIVEGGFLGTKSPRTIINAQIQNPADVFTRRIYNERLDQKNESNVKKSEQDSLQQRRNTIRQSSRESEEQQNARKNALRTERLQREAGRDQAQALQPTSYGQKTASYQDIFTTTMKDILQQQDTDAQTTMFSEVKDVTFFFPLISNEINNMKENVIGNKNTDGKFINNLGKSCELQCQNMGGTCWY